MIKAHDRLFVLKDYTCIWRDRNLLRAYRFDHDSMIMVTAYYKYTGKIHMQDEQGRQLVGVWDKERMKLV